MSKRTSKNGAVPQDRGNISAAVVISPHDSAVYDADSSVDTVKDIDQGPPVERGTRTHCHKGQKVYQLPIID